jgi:hypothetical protein
MSSTQQINIMVVIDTDKLLQDHSTLSQDPNNPTGLAHDCQYMVCVGSRGAVTGQGGADIKFQANVSDDVCFMGTSVYGNSDSAVIIYGIVPRGNPSTNVFNEFEYNSVTRDGAAMPNDKSPGRNGLPAVNKPANFSSFDAKVATKGTEAFLVRIAVYTLADDGETQKLKGYCYWDPTITVA